MFCEPSSAKPKGEASLAAVATAHRTPPNPEVPPAMSIVNISGGEDHVTASRK